jgi:ubiquinone/menaquinone biosynthesis C-methylase UbiE
MIPDHYARSNLITAIREGIAALGKTTATVTIDDLAPVDEFHIGGRVATDELVAQLHLTAADHVLDIGSGLGGAARFIAHRYGCRVSGIDLTRDYVEAGALLCRWVGLERHVSMHHADALAIPFGNETFDAAYMLHVGMNIEDKIKLFAEAARVLRPGARLGIYDVMRTDDGELAYPVPWAQTEESSALARPEQYRDALTSAGFSIRAQRDRREFALAYFSGLQAGAAGAKSRLGLHTLMGDRRPEQVSNMLDNISASRIAPIEMIAQKASPRTG